MCEHETGVKMWKEEQLSVVKLCSVERGTFDIFPFTNRKKHLGWATLPEYNCIKYEINVSSKHDEKTQITLE